MPTDVLVLGGGFVGLSAVRELARLRRKGADLRIRLVDRLPHNVFLPLLPNLISGMVRPEHICYELAPACSDLGVEFIRAQIKSISLDDTSVETDAGAFRADYMIICLGVVTNYFGNDEIRENTFELKSVRDALAIATEATTLMENAPIGGDPEEKAQVVIVGGGYTGFEIAGEISQLIHVRTDQPYDRLRDILQIQVVEQADVVLPHSPPRMREWATEMLKKYDVDVLTRTTVKEFPAPRTVVLTDGTVRYDAMVIWTPGVKPSPECEALSTPRTEGHRLAVDEYLRLPGGTNIFAAGDVAGAIPPGHEHPLYMGVQFSLKGGQCAARNIVHSMRKEPLSVYKPRDLGHVIPLAPGEGAGEVLGHEVEGRIPYWLHFLMSIYRSWNGRNRWSVLWIILKRRMTEFEQRRRSVSRY